MSQLPLVIHEYPKLAELCTELLANGVFDPRAFKRPNRLSRDAMQRFEDGLTSRRDFVWLMRAREAEFRRDDFSAARREEARANG